MGTSEGRVTQAKEEASARDRKQDRLDALEEAQRPVRARPERERGNVGGDELKEATEASFEVRPACCGGTGRTLMTSLQSQLSSSRHLLWLRVSLLSS